jgi:hypothetical protein
LKGYKNEGVVDWSPDGEMIASADSSGIVNLWNTGSWRISKKFRVRPESYDVAWAPDGTAFPIGFRNEVAD